MTTSLSSKKASHEWRMAFLTLRDEALHYDNSKSIGDLLNRVIFSQIATLTAASPCLPTHEVTSDIVFLVELASNWRRSRHKDFVPAFHNISHMIYEICQGLQVDLQFNSSSWKLLLDSYAQMLQRSLNDCAQESMISETFKSVMLFLEILRLFAGSHQKKFTIYDDIQVGNFLLKLIEYLNLHILASFNFLKSADKHADYWQCQTSAYVMLYEVIQRVGFSLPGDMWVRTIEVLRKVLDHIPLAGSISEDQVMSRFLVAALNCLHAVTVDPKGSVKDHVSSFVASLRLLLLYGLSRRPVNNIKIRSRKEEELSISLPEESGSTSNTPYRPPHLRRRENSRPTKSEISNSHNSVAQETLGSSSDSDCSDCDGGSKDFYSSQFAKVRVCSILCIQDLCQVDPKSFINQWMALLPTTDVLQPRKLEATMMTCLMFDPYVKVQMASSSALAVMLDRQASAYLQMAEYVESPKWSAFMPLSSSLGCMLMQMHTGIMHKIQRERHNRLLTSLLKLLTILISRTPYSRMPKELLPKVIIFVIEKIYNVQGVINDLNDHLISLLGCIGAALSTTPPSQQVNNLLIQELSTDISINGSNPRILSILFQYSSQVSWRPACVEALQALRSVFHLYPHLASQCWERVTCLVSDIFYVSNHTIASKGKDSCSYVFIDEKALAASIKVLDECLRGISGFKGTEDLDDKLYESSFISESTRSKKVSSAPSFVCENIGNSDCEKHICHLVGECWCQTIEKLLPQLLQHKFAMVRTASVTCFAGFTYLAFDSLSKENQDFVINSLLYAAVYDEIPSVRSSACRAIGVVSCFQQFPWSAEIFGRFFNAIEKNLNDPVVTVRTTASWSLANMCESMRHCMELKEHQYTSLDDELMLRLTHVALSLYKEGDKIKSNAVRGLGNLARFVDYSRFSCQNKNLTHSDYSKHSSDYQHQESLLALVVQAFLSCVTSGNVKVQWNACHAVGNLFRNRSIILHDMDWAPSIYSILLLLLRDSSNFKIKIQAAAALAVPPSIRDYGRSYTDIVQVLLHVLENFDSIQISDPSSFKYRVALEQQITATVLHLLSLLSSSDCDGVSKDFFTKKAMFLKEWLSSLCAALDSLDCDPDNKKKVMVDAALRSLAQFFRNCGHLLASTFYQMSIDRTLISSV